MRGTEKTRKEHVCRIGKEIFKIVFWNIAGIIGKDREFWQYIDSFDFVSLTETWLEEKNWCNIKGKLSQEFKWDYTSAKRNNKKD